MKTHYNHHLLPLLTVLALAACSHQKTVDRRVDAEVKAQPAVEMGGPVAAESRSLILNAPELKPEQREKLLALHAKVAGEVKAIREEEGKLKMVFFRAVLNPKTEDREIATLKGRILKLERKKTDRMLSALEETRSILGRHEIPQDSQLFRALMLHHSNEL